MRWAIKNQLNDAFDAIESLERQAEELSESMTMRTKGCKDVQRNFERCKRNIESLRVTFGLLEAELIAKGRHEASLAETSS